MQDFEAANFFTDESLINDSLPYLSSLRSKCPVLREPHYGTLMVTGYEEALELYKQGDNFSSCLAVTGPIPGLPFKPAGDDIGEEIERHRPELPWATHFITFDGQQHSAHRGLLTRLLTFDRLRKNAEYVEKLADRLIDRFIDHGKCEIVSEYSQPLATLVIADLLGVPEEDRDELVAIIGPPPGMVGKPEHKSAPDPLDYLDRRFTAYLQERRKEPSDDMMSELANSRFRDGSVPDLGALVRIATFLFVAGQDTSAKLIASAFKILGDCPHLQQRLRAERDRIPDFVEETLRFESPSKVSFRVARHTTSIGTVEVPAGSLTMVALGAANRDPRRFEQPDEFQLDRPHLRDHLAFGRGAHACPGAVLARLETRVTLERFLERTTNIRISETEHGPPGARRYTKVPTYLLNGVTALHLEFTT
ncbi:MAG: cytochrome P450 [Steroidobacteraceae bacterium]|jgi:cytochrome P450